MPPRSPLLESLSAPIVQAPMAGGPTTPALAAGVNRGGGLGFLAAGYLTPDRAHGRRTGDAEVINLWAGQAHRLATEDTAEEITRRLAEEARQALAATAARWVTGGRP